MSIVAIAAFQPLSLLAIYLLWYSTVMNFRTTKIVKLSAYHWQMLTICCSMGLLALALSPARQEWPIEEYLQNTRLWNKFNQFLGRRHIQQ
jgi:hypothetical protein